MTKFKNSKAKDFIYKLSAILILIAAVSYLFNETVATYIMIAGVLGFAVTTFLSPYPGDSIRGKRLYNMQIFGIAFMAMGCYLMYEKMTAWIIAMLIAAVLILYSSILLPKTYAKENEDKNVNKKK